MVWISKSDAETVAIQELTALPPRAAAIVGVALVHSRIATMVAAKFPNDGNTKKGLFRENGALAGYDTQTKMAYAFGIISDRALRDCQRLGRVRNLFAHNLEVADFKHPLVGPECLELELVERHLFPQGEESADRSISPRSYIENLAENLADNRNRFQLTAMLVTSSLTPLIQAGGVQKPAVRRVLI
ncbi:MltR family transcriptional regulator [Phenylobacterium sp.]|uniref:MltR family transcriptional regulator n=1 Tax=Phenylobacterium sp. TaxID=1871053 RepID=UPI002734DC76|nr:MltR family transcriptional regulator [Phenylobacterium sp.]MDP3852916.1 hypothetical protein [Phenylobacterium sp.]